EERARVVHSLLLPRPLLLSLAGPAGPVGGLRGPRHHAREDVPVAPVPRPGAPGGDPRRLTRSGRLALTRSGSQVLRDAFGVLYRRRRASGQLGGPCGPRTAQGNAPRCGAT